MSDLTTTSWLQRLLDSVLGVLFGIALVIGSIALLWWNESRAVEAIRALDQGARQIVEISATTVDPAAQGRLVHASSMMTTQAPARDAGFGIGGDGMLRLRRTVEMYQWVETTSSRTENNLGGSKTTETTYNYKKQWSESPENSGNFHDQSGHENPQMPVRSTTIDSQRVRLGAYQVDRAVLQQVAAFAPLDPPHDAAFPAGYRADGDMIYRGGNSASPAIGDLRIHYAAVASQMMSVVAAQSGDTLAVFHAANGYQIALAAPGVMPAAAMFQEKKQEEATLTWILRGAGFVAMLIGFMLIANPLAVLASVLPFLGDLVGAGTFLMSLAVSVPVTLVVIAAAWIANRPLIGGGLIVAAIAFLVLLPKLRGVKARAA